MCVRPQPATQRGQRWLRSLGRPLARGPRTRRRPSDVKTDPSRASKPSASRRQSRPGWPRPRPGAPLVRTARTVHTRAHTQCVHAHTHLHGHPCAQARTCMHTHVHTPAEARGRITRAHPSARWSRPALARLLPQLRSCARSTAFTVACPRTSEDVSKEPLRAVRFSAAVGVYLLRIPAHSVASTRGNSDRVTAWNRTVARDWRGLFRGPPALAPGCAHLGPHRPLISNVPLGPQQGDCHEEGTGQVRLGGRLGAGPVIAPSARTEVFLQEPRWAVREAGSGRARAGRACVRGAAGGGAGSQRRPWAFGGAHAERLPLSAAWCSHPRGANAGGPKHEREAPCSDSEVPADRRLGREGPPPPAVTSGWVCIQCPSPSTPAPYGDAREPGNGSRGLRPRGRANAHA